ncbi:penicillin acylase family protein [Arenibacter palladensis]|uniref:penicillin acylase family protein n=1 Tax=Arenibacter palladensis TaxID=237373 RepID=UPI0026E40D16|nr:penicillin acylase family protein [Arenibacter palladensis]MDO6602067.1 penicillin acylase family protein [Arenibacter palladensis]
MKVFKKLLWIVLGIVAIIALSSAVYVYTHTPEYVGNIEIDKLSKKVEVYFDTYGIPHIYGEKEEDALRALGYVHAQDRLWQMELLRRISIGGLSEVFGEDMIKTDKFFLSLGIDDASLKTVENVSKVSPMVVLSQAYLDGINQFIAEGPTPIEFHLTGLEKTPFTLKDIYNTVGYMAFSFAMAHKTDPLLTNIKNQLGPAYLADLEIGVDPKSTLIKNYKPSIRDSIKNEIAGLVSEVLKDFPVPQFEGSNSWVIAPGKTKNGKVILANDPHIGFAQPSVWYEAHVNAPNYEKYGYHLAGVPFPLLGHDRKLAYGLTMFENDDIDFYYEEEKPNDSSFYKTSAGWKKYELVTKTIKVKGEDDLSFTFKKTHHGPILNGIADQVMDQRPIAMSWIYTKLENKVMDALYGMSHAQNLSEFKKALPYIHAPGLNIMYGDAVGNVGWFATAKLYQMPDSTDTKFILEGNAGKDEPIRYLDFSENPMAINPSWNYVYSANNPPDSINGKFYPGYYLPENRAKRIVALLEPKNDWDREAVQQMLLDATSGVNAKVVTNLAKSMEVKEMTEAQISVLDKMNVWDGNNQLQQIEPTVYHRWIYFLLKNTFEDELGPQMFQQMLDTHFHKRLIAPMASKDDSVWWDDVNTPDSVETKNVMVNLSFRQAFQSLEEDLGRDPNKWTWNKVHTLEHGHPIGQIKALRSFFNVGPFPVSGTREVINNMYFKYDDTGLYPATSGPSTRRVIDFSDIENSVSILPTGQSGNPFSEHYEDQAEMYNQSKFRKMMMNKEEIIKTQKSILVFEPKK